MSKTLSAKYYQVNKETPQKKTIRKSYQNLSKEEKKKRQYDLEHYKNLSEDKKQKFVKYRKKFYRSEKSNDLEILKVYIKTDEKLYIYTKRFILRKSKKV